MILTAPQIVWKGLNEIKQDIGIDTGRCRICGGHLLNSAIPINTLDFKGWTDEAFIKCPESEYICEPCKDIKKMYNQNLHKGFIATENSFSWFDEAQDIVTAITQLPNDPFVLLFKTWGGAFRRHSIYFAPVNYNKEQVCALFIFHPWHQPGKTKDDSLSLATMIFQPTRILQLINQLEAKEEDVYQRNPIHHGTELHLAAFIVGTKQREDKAAKKQTKK